MHALGLMGCTAVRTPFQAITVCPAHLVTQDPSRLAMVWSRLLLISRQVDSCLKPKTEQERQHLLNKY